MGQVGHETQQLALPVQLPADARFESFVDGENSHLVTYLRGLASDFYEPTKQFSYVWGRRGTGKTHLLAALCADFELHQKSAIYLPLRELKNEPAEALLQGLEQFQLIALDDLDAVTEHQGWCDALFALYNRVIDQGNGYLVAAGHSSAEQVDFKLPDLKSRVQAGTIFQLKLLDDTAKIEALQLQAEKRGLELTRSVGEFMITRLSRDMHELTRVLDKLDKASIAEQRRLTLPFVKQVLDL